MAQATALRHDSASIPKLGDYQHALADYDAALKLWPRHLENESRRFRGQIRRH
jgi:hypothetical protein